MCSLRQLKDKTLSEIISYYDMCNREGVILQKGMNFRISKNHSVILMSLQPNAPYDDDLQEGGTVLIYEGHDVPRSLDISDPKQVDQPMKTKSGRLTPNGRFYEAAQKSKKGEQPPERVRVYEKIRPGIWSYNGVFHLVDAWHKKSNDRMVFKFKLITVEGDDEQSSTPLIRDNRRRVIPADVKQEVWRRDGGKCVKCGAPDELHFDHIVPYSKGGTSSLASNIQLLCARHNIRKRDLIE
jgi:hypothetical protein